MRKRRLRELKAEFVRGHLQGLALLTPPFSVCSLPKHAGEGCPGHGESLRAAPCPHFATTLTSLIYSFSLSIKNRGLPVKDLAHPSEDLAHPSEDDTLLWCHQKPPSLPFRIGTASLLFPFSPVFPTNSQGGVFEA